MYGQSTSDMAEQTQSAQRKYRRLHPLNYMFERVTHAVEKVREQLEYHAQLRRSKKPMIDLLEKHLKEIRPAALKCVVVKNNGETARVRYHDPNSPGNPHLERVVDLASRKCDCLCFQDSRKICAHGLSFAMQKDPELGDADVMLKYSGAEYATASEEQLIGCQDTLASFELCAIPTDDELLQRLEAPTEIVSAATPCTTRHCTTLRHGTQHTMAQYTLFYSTQCTLQYTLH